MVAKRAPALDRIDINILAALQRNGRATVQALAERVGLSPRACLERVRRLEAAKIITGYKADIDIARLSRPINVFAEIILDRQARQAGFEQRLARIEEVVECWEVGGTVDYIARFVCPDLATYEELTSRLIADANLGVARIVSHVALRPIRRFGGYPESLLSGKSE
jgi:DNA-binding Lrp family transcriptional regulator